MPCAISIKPFELEVLQPTSTCALMGRRGSGKTVLLNNIMYHLRSTFHCGIAMAGSAAAYDNMLQFVPNNFVFPEWREDKVQWLLDYQEKRKKEGKAVKQMFILLDDLTYDPKFLKSRTVSKLFCNGRHYNVFVILLTQYMMDIPAALRNNIDFVFAFHDSSFANKDRLYRNFFGVFETRNDFAQVFDKCTENHSCIVLNNKKDTGISDSVSHFHASLNIPAFQLGHAMFWQTDVVKTINSGTSLKSEENQFNEEKISDKFSITHVIKRSSNNTDEEKTV
jgi:hypothetical protein